MSTLDTVFLIITACAISLFFLLGAVLVGLTIGLVRKARKVIAKAEDAIDSVEAAAVVLKNARGPVGAFHLLKNIIELVNKRRD